MLKLAQKTYMLSSVTRINIKNVSLKKYYNSPLRKFTLNKLSVKKRETIDINPTVEDLIKILPIFFKYKICRKCYGSGIVTCVACNGVSKISHSLADYVCSNCINGVVPCDKCNAFQNIYLI